MIEVGVLRGIIAGARCSGRGEVCCTTVTIGCASITTKTFRERRAKKKKKKKKKKQKEKREGNYRVSLEGFEAVECQTFSKHFLAA